MFKSPKVTACKCNILLGHLVLRRMNHFSLKKSHLLLKVVSSLVLTVAICFYFFFRNNVVRLRVFYEELNYQKIEQQQAWTVSIAFLKCA